MPPLPPPHNGAAPRPIFRIPIPEALHIFHPRALGDAVTVPQGYGDAPNGPDPGAVVGITLGAVGGFLLLLAVIQWCLNLGQGPRMEETGSVGGGNSSVVSRHSRPRGHPHRQHSHRPHRHHRRSRRATVEIRQHERVVPVIVDDQIVVEEYNSARPRSVSRAPPSLPRTPPPREVYDDDGDDIIEVVHEDSTPPRRRRDSVRSQHTRRSDDRRSMYRDDMYVRDVSRPRSMSRQRSMSRR